MRPRNCLRSVTAISLLLVCFPLCGGSAGSARLAAPRMAEALPDLSGLAWIDGDNFLAVHDAKNPVENDRPRISLLRLPESLDGVAFKPVALDWPAPLGPGSDLESIARIPGTDSFLLVESGEGRSDRRQFRRVFLIEVKDSRARLLAFTELPGPVTNVEGSAVASLEGRLIFLWAERGDDRPRSELYWADLQLRPLRLGAVNRAYFTPAGFAGRSKRPVSAIEIDSRGRIYIASAYDPDDNGPFTSLIWRAGRIQAERGNRIRPVLLSRPVRLATLDGFKVESLAVREAGGGRVELFAGTDDENYGGVLRAIPMGQ